MISSSHLIGALVRRGLETAPQHLAKREDVKRVVFSLPFAAFTILTLIFIVGIIAVGAQKKKKKKKKKKTLSFVSAHANGC